mmetsp:Transcript_14931/g.18098  ORF Transcript_14931/g.18098 Transcript_14931/m.18098 type:complete len:91 (-) Transcript_14931:1641-1913(-)
MTYRNHKATNYKTECKKEGRKKARQRPKCVLNLSAMTLLFCCFYTSGRIKVFLHLPFLLEHRTGEVNFIIRIARQGRYNTACKSSVGVWV